MERELINGYDGPLVGDRSDEFHRILIDDSIIPSADAPFWNEIATFAYSFNGYSGLGGQEALDAVLERAGAGRFLEEPEVLDRLTLAELRSLLFFQYRFLRHTGGDPHGYEVDYVRALLDRIREPVNRDRSADPAPVTERERFARDVLHLAQSIEPDACLDTPLVVLDPEQPPTDESFFEALGKRYGWPVDVDPHRAIATLGGDMTPIYTVSDAIHVWTTSERTSKRPQGFTGDTQGIQISPRDPAESTPSARIESQNKQPSADTASDTQHASTEEDEWKSKAKEASDHLKTIARHNGLQIREDHRHLGLGEKWSVVIGKGKRAFYEQVVVEELTPDTIVITHDRTHSQKQITARKAIALMTRAGRRSK